MKIVIPNKLDLLACSVSETDSVDGAVWNAATTYSKGVKVRYNHVKYESIEDNNKGNQPDKTWSGIEARWKKVEATLPWMMLDDFVETQTKGPVGQKLTFTVPFVHADCFAMLNLNGITARITLIDQDADPSILHDISDFSLYEYNYSPLVTSDILHDREYSLMEDIFHHSLFEYNYFPIQKRSDLVVTGLPSPARGLLKVEIETLDTESAAVGHIIVGRAQNPGWTEYGAEIGLTDYSRKIVDEFGVTTLVRRSFASHGSFPVYLHPNQMDYVARMLQSVRGTPCLWLGDNDEPGHQCLNIYGWMEDFRMVCEGPNNIDLSIEVQGLI